MAENRDLHEVLADALGTELGADVTPEALSRVFELHGITIVDAGRVADLEAHEREEALQDEILIESLEHEAAMLLDEATP